MSASTTPVRASSPLTAQKRAEADPFVYRCRLVQAAALLVLAAGVALISSHLAGVVGFDETLLWTGVGLMATALLVTGAAELYVRNAASAAIEKRSRPNRGGRAADKPVPKRATVAKREETGRPTRQESISLRFNNLSTAQKRGVLEALTPKERIFQMACWLSICEEDSPDIAIIPEYISHAFANRQLMPIFEALSRHPVMTLAITQPVDALPGARAALKPTSTHLFQRASTRYFIANQNPFRFLQKIPSGQDDSLIARLIVHLIDGPIPPAEKLSPDEWNEFVTQILPAHQAAVELIDGDRFREAMRVLQQSWIMSQVT